MPSKVVPPELGVQSFTCPYCAAVSHQTWYMVFAHSYEKKGQGPFMPRGVPVEAPPDVKSFFEKLCSRKIFYEYQQYGSSSTSHLCNLYVSRCYSCDQWSVWVADGLVYPATKSDITPNEDMPDDAKADFVEAASIVDQSPRGAAALLRLCVQKIMKYLGEKGEKLNDDIGSLVRKGMDPRIQQSLDIVRVSGNNAVHPGEIDMDDKATALRLFELVNIIVADRISTPARIKAMYDELPGGAIEGIEKRDKTKE
jgi:Domain of unknown function (DUF4145)